MIKICSPAIIYLLFSITQILIDTFKGLYNTAFIKVIVTIMVTLLLNILCEQGLGFVSWIIVFIPFILMTVIVSMVLYVFGLDAAKGKFNRSKTCDQKCDKSISMDALGNIIIYHPKYEPKNKPVYYQSPNIIVPNPHNTYEKTIKSNPAYYNGSSSPAYQS
jgi:hypothetical protein